MPRSNRARERSLVREMLQTLVGQRPVIAKRDSTPKDLRPQIDAPEVGYV
jgi:hypothetical protein